MVTTDGHSGTFVASCNNMIRLERERRASSVSQYLTQLGVDSARITETPRGKLDATGTDDATWGRDRRVDVDLR
jgi:hypothetical protein